MGLTHSIHRTLILRLLFAALAIAATLAALVLWVELRNMDTYVADQASVATEHLRWAIMDELDKPALGDHARIRSILEKPMSVRAWPSGGHFVLVRILDSEFDEAVRVSDPSYAHLGSVTAFVAAGLDRAALADHGAWRRISRVDGDVLIHLRTVLKSSRGEPAGYMEGVYAVAPSLLARARTQAAVTALIAALVVLLTALLLYPVIVRLLGRVSGLTEDLLHANLEILNVLGSAIAKRDSDTDIHNYRVTIYAIRLGQVLGLPDDEMRSLIKGAFLHDVGKIGVRDGILLKPGNLTDGEFEEMKQHVRHGLDIVSRSSWLSDAAPVVGGHHERYDGSGYLEGRRNGDIPRVARVFAVADVFDALTSKRPYKEAFAFEDAMRIIVGGRGTHFDPEILDAFEKIAPTLYETYAGRDDGKPRGDLRRMGSPYFSGRGARDAAGRTLQGRVS
ncbi:MAG TPA: HD-GYP domain-containing protein [Deltaproteobacteria bacterium]|nr:HD-GYP domain-containing protein [Deltaproteobacteria bacterium]